MLRAMVSDWRGKFGQPSLGFGAVLLAAGKSGDLTSFPLLRLAQVGGGHPPSHPLRGSDGTAP